MISIWNMNRSENCLKSWDAQDEIRGVIIVPELMKEGYG